MNLSKTLEGLAQEEGRPLNLGAVVDAMQDQGFGLMLMLLALPSALPLPAAGYSTPFGLMLFVLGWQRLKGHTVAQLPKRARAVVLGASTVRRMLRASQWVLHNVERFLKPRGRIWWEASTGTLIQGGTIMTMAFLMILPIPLTNTGPAAVIFAMGLAMARRDGLLGILALLAALGGLCIYAFILMFVSDLFLG